MVKFVSYTAILFIVALEYFSFAFGAAIGVVKRIEDGAGFDKQSTAVYTVYETQYADAVESPLSLTTSSGKFSGIDVSPIVMDVTAAKITSTAALGDTDNDPCPDCEESDKILQNVLSELSELRSRIAECTDGGFIGAKASGVIDGAENLLTMIQTLPSTLKSAVKEEIATSGGIGFLGTTGISLAIPNGASSTVITVGDSQATGKPHLFV